ncbi:peroxisomal acyl-coenzyme A oxidase 3-like [Odontesthes bonariensis]
MGNPWKAVILDDCLGMYDWAMVVKFFLNKKSCCGLRSLGPCYFEDMPALGPTDDNLVHTYTNKDITNLKEDIRKLSDELKSKNEMLNSLLDLDHQQSMHIASLKTALQDTVLWDPGTSPRPSSSSTPRHTLWSEVVCRRKKASNRDDLVLSNRFEALSTLTSDGALVAPPPSYGPVAAGTEGLAPSSARPVATRARANRQARRSLSSSGKRRQLLRDAVSGHTETHHRLDREHGLVGARTCGRRCWNLRLISCRCWTDDPECFAGWVWLPRTWPRCIHRGNIHGQACPGNQVPHILLPSKGKTFVLQVRDPKTLLALPGVLVGDMGKKLGQNGLDNGFAFFHNVRIPRESLLNRTGDVTPDGRYVTPFKDPNKRFGASLGALSGGRIYISRMALINLKLAMTVAIRFSATRRQFGPKDTEEIPVLEYQLQQWRLIPYLAAAYALEHFTKSTFMNFLEFQIGQMMKDSSDRQVSEHDPQIHAIGCSSKPLGSWTAQRGIQECREACGGHGYLAMNRLGDLRDDNDPNCTYEGDNNVLLQQTSNYLLGWLHTKLHDGVRIESPLHTVDFLDDFKRILESRFTATTLEECMDSKVPLAAYRWLVCFLLEESYKRLEQERALGKKDFEARNNSQVYYCRSLAITYIEHNCLQRFHDLATDEDTPADLKAVLRKLCALYGLWSLSSHMATLYQGSYFSGRKPAELVQMAIITLCSQLKDDAVALVDVLAPTDFILNSPIGCADGQLNKNLWSTVMQGSQVLERPSWWKEFCCDKPAVGSLRPKL